MSGSAPTIPSPSTPSWRMAAGIAILAVLALAGVFLVPVYLHNLELEHFIQAQIASSDEALRHAILSRGRVLGLDIVPDHLQIRHPPASHRTEVRYMVRVDLRLYTVDLHFSSTTSGADPWRAHDTGSEARP